MVGLAYIVPSRIGGRAANAMQVMKMGQALLVGGHDTLMIAQADGVLGDTDSLKTLYGVCRVPRLVTLSAPGRWGIHLFNLRAALLARRSGSRLVLTRSVGAALFSALLGLPVIWECHAPPQGFERRLFQWLVAQRNFRRLVVISAALKAIMAEHHPETRDIDMVVAHDGVDLEAFEGLPSPIEAKVAIRLDPARPAAGYAGHLYAGRGVELIFDCAAQCPGWDFFFAGGTPEDIDRRKTEVTDRGLLNVYFLGFVENANLPGVMAAADVLLMPYQRAVKVSGGKLDTAQWMSPLKMFEYLGMGRAIIASDLAVLREVLTEDICRLINPDRTEDWVSALQELEDSEVRAALATKACETAAAYDWSRRVEMILQRFAP